MRFSGPVVGNWLFYLLNVMIALGFVMKREYGLLVHPVATSFFYTGILLAERWSRLRLSTPVRVLVITTLVSHNLFGNLLEAYDKTAFFDNALHLFGTFAFALLGFEVFETFFTMRSSRPALFSFFFVLLLGFSLGAFFELFEFFLDVAYGGNTQKGLRDTNLDLLFDFIGAVIAGGTKGYGEYKKFKV